MHILTECGYPGGHELWLGGGDGYRICRKETSTLLGNEGMITRIVRLRDPGLPSTLLWTRLHHASRYRTP